LTNQVIVQRLQLGSRRADPISERRALDLDALTRQDLGLPVKCCTPDYVAETLPIA
jgi:hypothetical protein